MTTFKYFLLLWFFTISIAWTEENTAPPSSDNSFSQPCVNTDKVIRRRPVVNIIGGLGVDNVKGVDNSPMSTLKGDTSSFVSFTLNISKDGSCYAYPHPHLYIAEKMAEDRRKGEITILSSANSVNPRYLDNFESINVKDLTKDLEPDCPVKKMAEKYHDLDAYRMVGHCVRTYHRTFDNFIYTNPEGKASSFISCIRKGPPYLVCDHEFLYKDKNHHKKTIYFDYPPIVFYISYRREHLPYWREIENAVRQYFDSVTFNPYTLKPIMEN